MQRCNTNNIPISPKRQTNSPASPYYSKKRSPLDPRFARVAGAPPFPESFSVEENKEQNKDQNEEQNKYPLVESEVAMMLLGCHSVYIPWSCVREYTCASQGVKSRHDVIVSEI